MANSVFVNDLRALLWRWEMNWIRRAAKQVLKNVVVKRTVRLKDQAVSLYVSPDAQLKYLRVGCAAFDRDLVEVAELLIRPEDCVWDIGANVGVFTFAAAAVATRGSVVSVEADIWLAGLLRKSALLDSNKERNIRVLPCAVAEANGIAAFNIAVEGRASNVLAKSSRATEVGVRETQYVPVLTMDTLLATQPRPNFIKMDVEGAEWLALQGAENIISEVRPIFYMEISAVSLSAVLNMFDRYGYDVFDCNGGPTDTFVPNYYFVPRGDEYGQEKMAELRARNRSAKGSAHR
jgi:FkbM family methyltransferase